MPCYDPPRTETETRQECAREFRHNSPIAEMLCEAMRLIEIHGGIELMSESARLWWVEHKERDKRA